MSRKLIKKMKRTRIVHVDGIFAIPNEVMESDPESVKQFKALVLYDRLIEKGALTETVLERTTNGSEIVTQKLQVVIRG